MIKTAFWGRLKTTVTITFTLNSQFTASSGYAETGVYRVFEDDLSMSDVWDVLCDFFFFLSVSICNNSINTGYKVNKVQKFDEISWQSANGSWTAEVVSCKKKKKKNPLYSFVIMRISCRRVRGCTNILLFCHKMFSRNKKFALQTFFHRFIVCHFIRMFFRMSVDVSLQINNKRKSETGLNEASFLLLCWIFDVHM